jgi:hypothetical protein
MDLYGRVLNRANQLIPIAFTEVYNEFAKKRNEEEAKPIKTYSMDKVNTLMMLLASHIYFRDDASICELYNFKCAFLMKYPEYIVNRKDKVIDNIAEMAKLLNRPQFKEFAVTSDCVFLYYTTFLSRLLGQ